MLDLLPCVRFGIANWIYMKTNVSCANAINLLEYNEIKLDDCGSSSKMEIAFAGTNLLTQHDVPKQSKLKITTEIDR